MAKPVFLIMLPKPTEGKLYYVDKSKYLGITGLQTIQETLPDYRVLVIVDNTIDKMNFRILSEKLIDKHEYIRLKKLINEQTKEID